MRALPKHPHDVAPLKGVNKGVNKSKYIGFNMNVGEHKYSV